MSLTSGVAGRRLATACVTFAVALFGLTACGTTSVDPGAPAATGAAACRAQWRQFAAGIAGRDQEVDPSDLPDRWTTVSGTAHYYATSATRHDCGAALAQQRDEVRRIEAWSAQLRPYDMPYRFAALAPVATDYLLAPATTGPSTSTGTKAQHHSATKRQVQAALTVLQDTATLATTDMQAGWDEATSVDLGDAPAMQQTLRDLDFLAHDSTPYQRCLAALGVLEQLKADSTPLTPADPTP